MRTTKIICDSCADLPQSLLAAHGITCIPMTVSFGSEVFRDGIDIDADTFYARLTTTNQLPTTAQVTPMEYNRYFQEAVADGSEAVYVAFSSGLTGSVQNALAAAAEPELNGRVHVVDSLGASVGLGLMVLRAAELAETGKSAAEIAADIERFRARVCHVFTLDTLDYIFKGGRVSTFSLVASKMLDVKPILHMDMAGKLIPIDRARGRKRALNRLFEEMERLDVNPRGQRVGISHAHAAAEAQRMADYLRSHYGAAEVVVGEIGPVIGSHVGPGCVSIFFEGPEGRDKK